MIREWIPWNKDFIYERCFGPEKVLPDTQCAYEHADFRLSVSGGWLFELCTHAETFLTLQINFGGYIIITSEDVVVGKLKLNFDAVARDGIFPTKDTVQTCVKHMFTAFLLFSILEKNPSPYFHKLQTPTISVVPTMQHCICVACRTSVACTAVVNLSNLCVEMLCTTLAEVV